MAEHHRNNGVKHHVTPLTRYPAFKSFSSEHHHGLSLCWTIRQGLASGVDPIRIKRYTDWFFENHLLQHFEVEELQLFPILGEKDELIIQAVSEHRRLEELFNADADIAQTLHLIETELDHHIRFEERFVFPRIQEIANQSQLQLLDDIHREAPEADTWDDKFWEE